MRKLYEIFMILQIQKSIPLILIARYGKKLVLIEEDLNKEKDYNQSPKSMQWKTEKRL